MSKCIVCNNPTKGISFCSEKCFQIRKKQFDKYGSIY